jgi:molybdate transport system regulatory protein
VAAIVTNESIQSLGLKEGLRACALIKAFHIILAVNA